MDTRQRIINVEMFATSGPAKMALMAELKRREDANLPDPTDAECIAICEEADFRATHGVDGKRDSNGVPIQNGIGAWPHKVTANHMAALPNEGQAAWERAVRPLYKEAPDRARAIGLPELPRA